MTFAQDSHSGLYLPRHRAIIERARPRWSEDRCWRWWRDWTEDPAWQCAVARNVEWSGAVAGSGTAATTGSATPSSGDEAVLAIVSENTQSGDPTISTSTGSYTWTLRVGGVGTLDFTNEGHGWIYTAPISGSPSAFTITATFGTSTAWGIWAESFTGATDSPSGGWNTSQDVSAGNVNNIGTTLTGATDSYMIGCLVTSHSASGTGSGYSSPSGMTQRYLDRGGNGVPSRRCLMGAADRVPSGGADSYNWSWAGVHPPHDDVGAMAIEVEASGGGPTRDPEPHAIYVI